MERPSSVESHRNHREWVLVGKPSGEQVQTIPMRSFPFQVGRRDGLSLTLRSSTVSKCHAEFYFENGTLFLRDLESTNGTFLNGIRIDSPVAVKNHDLVQFERLEFELKERSPRETNVTLCYEGVIATAYELRQLLNRRAIVPHFQPIVRLKDGAVLGYEVLVRSSVDGLLTAYELFSAAERAGLEFELSDLCRMEGVRQGTSLVRRGALFVNTHPAEMGRPEFVPALEKLRRKFPNNKLVLEIHESSVCDRGLMQSLSQVLRELKIGVAYDDFGQGQSRLVELMDLPPHFLKFDMQLIRGIDTAPSARRKTVESLVRMTTELGTTALAEGIETAGEALACAEIGFTVAQGYFCGRPMSARDILTKRVQQDFGETSMSRPQTPSRSDCVPEFAGH